MAADASGENGQSVVRSHAQLGLVQLKQVHKYEMAQDFRLKMFLFFLGRTINNQHKLQTPDYALSLHPCRIFLPSIHHIIKIFSDLYKTSTKSAYHHLKKISRIRGAICKKRCF